MEDKNFEEMRKQIAILKGKLDKQEIVNEQLLRRTLKTKVSAIDSSERTSVVAGVLCLILFPLVAHEGIFSWPLAVATCLMMVFCIGATIYIHRPIHETNLMTENLATVARVMDRFKRQYDFWLHYITPTLILPWLTWACYEYGWQRAPEGMNPWMLVLPLLIGGAIGFCIGYYKHRKAVNAARNIIEQIEEI